MLKSKKVKMILILVAVIIILTILMFALGSSPSDLTINMYKKINNSQNYTIILKGREDDEYSYTISIAQRGIDISIDMISKSDDEEQHTTTLLEDENVYTIMHNDKEYATMSSKDIEADILIPEMKDIDEKTYQKGKEKVNGKTYYYEEYKGISTFLMLIDADNEENVKTRFYYDGDKLVYIKNMIDQDGEKLEELIQAECNYEVNEKLFEIPEDYAEV